MKKGIFKLMTAAIAVGSLASCSDEIIEKQGLNVSDGDLVASLPALTDGSAATRVAKIDGGSFVWDKDDQIQVYQLKSLTYSTYDLKGGSGTDIGVFEKKSGDDQTGADLYAVTQPKDSKTIYAISADDNGKAVLTATVKNRYDWETIESNGETAYKVPTPFWGEASISGNNISVEFKALTGFMKINLRDLPEDTKSIVLTTHEDFSLDDDFDDLLGIPGKEYTDGKNEPLSGTMRAELKDATSKLEVDERLAKYDYIRVDIEDIETDAAGDYIIYIPVVAQHYEKLYVMAVTDFGRGSYDYEGEMLREYEDYNWEVGAVNGFSLTEVVDLNVAGAKSFLEASNLIAKEMLSDGRHTLRVKMDPTGWTDDRLYIGSDLDTKGTSVEIEFTAAVPASGPNGFQIKECPVLMNGPAFDSFKAAQAMTVAKAGELDRKDMKRQRVVRLKFDAEVTGGELFAILPTSYVEIDSEVDQPKTFNIFAATLKKDGSHEGVSGYAKGNENKKDASIVIKGGVKADGTPVNYTQIKVLPNSQGDVYVTEADTYVSKLYFRGFDTFKGNVRITDALVDEINYDGVAPNNEIAIYTTGAAAIKTGITGVDDQTAKVYAYWTGKALSDNAISKGFDNATIYTAAQLQGVGLAAGLREGAGTFTFKDGTALTALPAVYEYQISDRVSSIWLGGDEYPWLGAQVGKLTGGALGDAFTDRDLVDPADPLANQLTQPIVIDGKNKELRNMKLDITDPYFVDPHVCCTTCGDYSVKVLESLGLVRSIYTTGAATVKNIYIDDAELESSYEIDDIATIVGTIYADGVVTLLNNNTTNIRIQAVGDNIGGQYGEIISGAKIVMSRLLAGQEVAETGVKKVFVKTTGNNVGGIAGAARSTTGTEIATAVAHLNEVSATDGENAGGLIGFNIFTGTSFLANSEVKIDDIFATQKESAKAIVLQNTGNNVGGMIGNNQGADAGVFVIGGTKTTVVATNIKADNQNAGGLVGFSKLNTTASEFYIAMDNSVKEQVDVTVNTLQANNGYVGGLVGYDRVSTHTYIGVKGTADANKTTGITVKVNNLNGAFAVGGLIGSNTTAEDVRADANRPVNVTLKAIDSTWELSDFTSTATYDYLNLTQDNRYKNCGSFGTLLGLKNEALKVDGKAAVNVSGDAISVVKEGTKNDAQNIISTLSYAANPGNVIKNSIKKDNLYFQLHSDTGSAIGVGSDVFWGDLNGFVGWDKHGNSYIIDGELQGAQIKNVRTAAY